MKILAAVARAHSPLFSFEECELDQPQAHEVLVALLACGVCHTDLAARDQHIRTPLPAVLGHEGVGIVQALGPGVTEFALGDKVLMSFGSCGECTPCRTQAPCYCRRLHTFCLLGQRLDGSSPVKHLGDAITGHFFGQSSFATHAIASTRNMLKLDPDLPAALMAPLACGFQTGMSAVVNVLKATPQDSLAVFGCGGVGLAAIMAAKVLGCRNIIAVDLQESRLQLALELGATHAVNGATQSSQSVIGDLGGLTRALDTTGNPGVVETAFNLLRPQGVLACAGIGAPGANISLNLNALMLTGRTLRGTVEGDAAPREFIPQMIRWYRQGLLPLDKLVTVYPFADLNQAIADMAQGRVIKPVLLMS